MTAAPRAPAQRPRPSASRVACLIGLVLASVACRISNEDHCVHKAIESDAWCAEAVPDKPFCSPCEAVDHGCVAERPDAEDCPEYTPDGSSGAGDDSESSGG